MASHGAGYWGRGNSIQGGFKPVVGALHIESQFARLLLAQFLRRPHLVQRDEPLDDLAAVFEVTVRDFVDALDHVGEERVETVLGEHVEFQGVEEGDEVFRRRGD